MDPIEDRKRTAELPQIRDIFGYNATVAEDAAELATRRYEYALEQRDKLNERIRFGCLTLNAASLVALASFVGSKSGIDVLGLSRTEMASLAILFAIGLALGAVAIWANGTHFIGLAAKAFEFRIEAAHRRALFQARTSERAEEAISEELSKGATPAPDFAFSKLTITLTNFSGGFWLGGLALVIAILSRGLVP